MEKFDTLYLHIGTRKTGTTVLQTLCYDNQDLLKSYDILYPTLDIVMKHDAVNHHKIFKTKNLRFSDVREAILEDRKNEKVCIISSELLEDVDRDENDIKELFRLAEKVKVIVYLRRQESYLESLYCQKIKLQYLKQNVSDYKIHLEYMEMLNFWSSLVGKKNIIVKPYEKTQFVNGNIFDDFLSVFNLSCGDGFQVSKSFSNPSLDRGALEFKRVINYLRISQSYNFRLARILEQRALKLGKDKTFSDHGILTTKEKVACIKRCEESNNKIANDFLGEDLLFQAPIPKVSEADEEKELDFLCQQTIQDIVTFLNDESPELIAVVVSYINIYLKHFAEDPYVVDKMKLILNSMLAYDKKSSFFIECFNNYRIYRRMRSRLNK